MNLVLWYLSFHTVYPRDNDQLKRFINLKFKALKIKLNITLCILETNKIEFICIVAFCRRDCYVMGDGRRLLVSGCSSTKLMDLKRSEEYQVIPDAKIGFPNHSRIVDKSTKGQ